MKIFWVSHSSVIPTYREKLSLLARRKDVELTLLLPQSWPEAGQRVFPQPQSPEVEGFRIITAPLVFEGRVKRHFYPSFFPYVEAAQPDLIHVEEEPYSLAAWQAARAAKKLGAKLVFFTWENLLERFEFPHQHIRDYVLKRADYAIAGDQEAAQLLKRAGYPSSQTSVIPQYGVNPQLFKPKKGPGLKKELGLGSFTVGYVGRLVPEKGLDGLLEAFARLGLKDSTLLLVGNGSLRQELEQKAAELGVDGRTKFIPAMSQQKLPDYLNSMDVLVLPSLTTLKWKEQFGRVLIEAQACGVPVIGSDSGAIPEVIGKAGLIFKEADTGELAKGLRRLAASKSLRKKLALAGIKQVLGLYTNRIIADRIHAIHRRVLASV
ncbi:MAG TPA: glycosyltransferase [bacterium]|nr:glycosyltransferase [bacterium]